MPVNLLKYGLALIATAVIIFFSVRIALKALKKGGYIKGFNISKSKRWKWKKDKEESPPLE